ncbi:MAG TPA: DUF507 family protein [Acidobacteriota bacterium]|jgi:hypothetical protein
MASKLSREKVNHLSHLLADWLNQQEILLDPAAKNDARLKIVDVMSEQLRQFEEIESRAHKKLAQQKNVAFGSTQYDVLFQRYCEEEFARLDRPT